MPTFQFTTKDGRTFEFDAPDPLTAASKWNAAQAQIAGQQQPPPMATPPGGALRAGVGAQQAAATAETKGSFLPVSRGIGGLRFDPSAGVLGMMNSAVTLPGDVFAGKVDPMSQGGIERATDLAMLGSPASAGAKWVRAAKTAVPTAGELRASGGAGREAVRGMGVEYSVDSVASWAAKVQADLLRDGMGPRVAEGTNGILDDILRDAQKVSGDPSARADFTSVEAARSNLQGIAQSAKDGKDRAAASRAIAALDGYIQRPDPANVVAGPAAEAGQLFARSNADYAAGSRAQSLDRLGANADRRAGATGSGRNYDNSVRGKIASFIEEPIAGGPSQAQRAGFTESEISMLEGIVKGTVPTNRLRDLANMLGGGGGLGAAVSLGLGSAGGAGAAVATGNPWLALLGAVPPVVGLGAKMAENAAMKAALRRASQTLRERSPTYQDAAASAPLKPQSPAARAQMIRMLLMQGLPQAERPTLDTTGKPIPPGTTIY